MENGRLTGEIIRMVRQSRKFTQAQLAARVGVTKEQISYLENGHRKISANLEADLRREFQLDDDTVNQLIIASRIAKGERPISNEQSRE